VVSFWSGFCAQLGQSSLHHEPRAEAVFGCKGSLPGTFILAARGYALGASGEAPESIVGVAL